jgi:hypothetical protein
VILNLRSQTYAKEEVRFSCTTSIFFDLVELAITRENTFRNALLFTCMMFATDSLYEVGFYDSGAGVVGIGCRLAGWWCFLADGWWGKRVCSRIV